MKTRRLAVLPVLGLALAGCQEPTQIVTVAPPGVVIDKTAEAETGDNAPSAIGEQAVTKGPEATATTERPEVKPAPPTAKGEVKTTAGGVKYETLQAGTGDEVKAGDTVVVNYVGKFDDGKTFDNGEGSSFRIASPDVIDGWVEGIAGMKVGERRKLTIPPALAYKDEGYPGKIPPNATLQFEVEVLRVKPGAPKK
jgi:FKBP-type peptidyl-prolyl cis-trans isomerase